MIVYLTSWLNLYSMSKYFSIVFGILLFISCSKNNQDEIEDTVIDTTSGTGGTGGDTTSTPSFSVVNCTDGQADGYTCLGYDLFAYLPLSNFESSFGNDIWGWTDPDTKKEYVILGLGDGTAFIEITDPLKPLYLGKLPTATVESVWRDVKVYQNHAFIVSEASGHGLQVFDLTRLRGVTTKQAFQADTRLTGLGSAHNIVINEDTGFAYVVGAKNNNGSPLANGGAIIIDINTPKQPQIVGNYAASQYIHDAQVVRYQGPDTDYNGREILFASSSDGNSYSNLVIADVTDKQNPIRIFQGSYPFPVYAHQNWLTEDHRYVLLGDEIDEQTHGYPTRTMIFDIQDLDAPELHFEFLGETSAIDHNGYVKGNRFYLASYAAGMRVYDLSDIDNKVITEIGFFDTYKNHNNASFVGVWSVYPYFESGILAISDSDNGLFLVKESE